MMSAGHAESGEDGAFRVEGLGVGGFVVQVESAEYTPQQLDVTVPEGEAPRPITVILRRGLAIAAGSRRRTGRRPPASSSTSAAPRASSRSPAGTTCAARRAPIPRAPSASTGWSPGATRWAPATMPAPARPRWSKRVPPTRWYCAFRRPARSSAASAIPTAHRWRGADVRVFPLSAAVSGPQRQRTDATGAATFSSLAAQRYRVSAAAPGWPQANREAVVSAGQQAESR